MSVPPDQLKTERYAREGSSTSGNPIFEWNLTHNTLGDLVQLVAQNMRLPIIFVPGIMGSNLMDLDGNAVWRLDSGFLGAPWGLIWGVAPKGPAGRQRLMHPARTRVDAEGKVPNEAVGTIVGRKKKDREAIYRDQRFWGEIADSSYHSYLTWLEDRLNGQGPNPALWREFSYAHPMLSAAPAPGQPRPEPKLLEGQEMAVRGLAAGAAERPWEPLKSDDLIQRAKFRMPVYACGYNWLDSNGNAAKRLRDRIRHVIAEEKKRGKCEQVLLITHSMGGLVARRCAQLEGMQDLIAGIVLGVMPAVGAAVAYRRCKVGMRDESLSAGLVIGSNGREVTAVFAQAPGALQLLPTREYRPGWLKIKSEDGRELEIQPQSDPCEAIYLRRDRWWGLVREEWLQPEGGIPLPWDEYEKNIEKARKFHEDISGHYHPQSHVYYGADAEIASFEGVEWRIQTPQGPYSITPADRPTPEQVSNMGFGDVTDSGWTGYSPIVTEQLSPERRSGPYPAHPRVQWVLKCGMQDGGGDGTVPVSSGRSPMLTAKNQAHIRQQFRLAGFEHEPSYRNDTARLATLFSIQKIAAEAKVVA